MEEDKKRVNSNESNASEVEHLASQALDGGWGWIVLLASFMTHLLMDGLSFSVGIVYTELLEYFNESKSATSWVGSLFIGVSLFCGPFASALANKYGCRAVTIFGSIILSLGLITSVFANSVRILCFTNGIVAGFGCSLLYVTSTLMPSFYFNKYRAMAIGISVSGSGIGAFVFAPLLEFLINEYGWRGAYLICAGLMLNLAVCGLVYRPLSENGRKVGSVRTSKSTSFNSTIECEDDDNVTHADVNIPLSVFPSSTPVLTATNDNDTTPPQRSLLLVPDNNHCTSNNGHLHKIGSCQSNQRLSTSEHMVGVDRNKQKTFKRQEVYLRRKDVLFDRNFCSVLNLRSQSCPTLSLKSSSLEENKMNWINVLQYAVSEVKTIMKEALDLSLLKNSIFFLFFVSNFALYMWYDIPYMYITDHAKTLGYPETQGVFLISVFGIASTIGQIVYGVLGDRPQVNLILLYGVSLMITGVATIFVPLLQDYTSLAVYCAVFGFTISTSYALETVVVVELLGLDCLAQAYGLVMLAQGIANLVGPPLAGWQSDITGSYHAAFYTSGAFTVVSGLIMLIILPIRECKHRATKNQSPCGSVTDKRNSTETGLTPELKVILV